MKNIFLKPSCSVFTDYLAHRGRFSLPPFSRPAAADSQTAKSFARRTGKKACVSLLPVPLKPRITCRRHGLFRYRSSTIIFGL